MGEKIHVLSAVFGSEYDGFINGANKVIHKSGEVGIAVGRALAAVDNMLTRLAAAATATAAIVGGTVAKLGGDFLVLEENAKTSFETLLGSAEAAKEMWLELKEIARSSPFQLDNIKDAAQRLLGMGYAGKDIPRVLRAIGDAIAAMGGGQEMIQRVSIALGQIRAKGVVAAEEMLQLAENGIPAWQMLADAIGTDIPTAMKLVEQRAISSDIAIEVLLRGIEQRFGGMSLKMATNWTGLWSAFTDTVKEKSGDVMKPLFVAAKRWLQQVTDYLSGPAFRGFVGEITIRIQSMVDEVNRLFGDLGRGNGLQNAQSMLLSLLDVIRDAIGWIRDNRGAIEEWGTALGSWLKPIGQLIAAYPQLVMFFGLFKVAQLFGITTALMEVSRAIFSIGAAVTSGQLTSSTSVLSQLWRVLSVDISTPLKNMAVAGWGAFVDGYRRAQQAASKASSEIGGALAPVFSKMTTEAQRAASAAQQFAQGMEATALSTARQWRYTERAAEVLRLQTTAMSTFTGNLAPAINGLRLLGSTQQGSNMAMLNYVGALIPAEVRTQALATSQRVLQSTARLVDNTLRGAQSAFEMSTTSVVSATRASQILAQTQKGSLIPSFTQLTSVMRGVSGGAANVLKVGFQNLTQVLQQTASSLFTVENIANGLTFGVAIAGTLALMHAQQKLNDELDRYEFLRNRNQRREDNKKNTEAEKLSSIQDPTQRKAEIEKAIADAEKELAGRKAQSNMTQKALEERRRQENERLGKDSIQYSSLGIPYGELAPGLSEMIGSTLRPIAESLSGGGVVGDLKRQAEEEKQLENKADARLQALKSLLNGITAISSTAAISQPPSSSQPALSFDPNAKGKEKAAAATAKDIESASKQFVNHLADLLQQGLPASVVQNYQRQFDALAESFENGELSAENFEIAVEELSNSADRIARSGGDLRDFGERMAKAVDQGLPKAYADLLQRSMEQLAAQFQTGQITEDQYDRNKSMLNERAAAVGRLSDQRRDFTVKANENVADGKLTQDQANGFIESLKALQGQLATGQINTFAYETELKKLNDLMANQVQKNAAIRESNQKMETLYKSLLESGMKPTQEGIRLVNAEVQRLQNQLREGRISVDEFNHAIGLLGDQINKEAERAQRAAILRGDWANAGEEFNIQRAIENRLLDIRRQQFGTAIDNIVQRMTGFGNAVSSVTGAINDARQTLRTGINSTVTFINEQLNSPIVWDRIQVLTQQIQILSNSMKQAPTYTIQKRLADQIEALNAQLSAAYEQTAPKFFAPQGNSRFEDPGTVMITNNLTMPNVTSLSQAQIYDLADKISREQQRRGIFR